MAAGIDTAASITALISLSAAVFKGCIQGYQILSAAKHAGQKIERADILIEWEEYRLVQWGQRVGLSEVGSRQNPFLPWQMIRDTLQQVKNIFQDTDRLRDRYGLIRDNNLPTASSSSQAKSDKSNKKKISLSRAALKFKVFRESVANPSELLFRLRWAVIDDSKIQQLIGDLRAFNDRLHGFLDIQDQKFLGGALSILLQDLVSRTDSSYDLETLISISDSDQIDNVRAIEAAAEFKRVRMHLGFDRRVGERAGPLNVRQKVVKIPYSKLTLVSEVYEKHVMRYVSKKRQLDTSVLVEWKFIRRELEATLRQRVEGLTLLLSNAADSAFGTLKSIGYTSNDDGSSPFVPYGYVFSLPVPGNKAGTVRIMNLAEVITERRTLSLSIRHRYATKLAQAVLQFHTAGWLHKGIQPDNIVFISTAGGTDDKTDKSRDSDSDLEGPYIIGFSYARADNPLEMTEDPSKNSWSDAYRHPDLLKSSRPSHNKTHDLYSLGCVLTDIATWRLRVDLTSELVDADANANANANTNIKTATSKPTTPSTKGQGQRQAQAERGRPSTIEQSLNKQISFSAGEVYVEAIGLCFHPQMPETPKYEDEDENDDDDRNDKGDEEDDEDEANVIMEASVGNQLEIVRLLKSCQF